jgi:hypothetical protein
VSGSPSRARRAGKVSWGYSIRFSARAALFLLAALAVNFDLWPVFASQERLSFFPHPQPETVPSGKKYRGPFRRIFPRAVRRAETGKESGPR